ncbi:hypothetical protein K450DRAFT_261931 [Umbelopsis ramanniana AG]|uniref:Long-chain-fatty-acid--CoA ligase n=1 Tax=Umbelopsis ramanniana AG TaxID=1314678 RepID=A0AAD5E218_UMBRA|nr:uncharacterized protein K450DRAFT_261931 [Umbelopsis ramanniana AG]KAI8575419.1 hypothetical protein K450DRAFT_261931 [Umbelopsis ramanniana AG]
MSAPQQFTVNVPGAVQKDGETLPRRHFKFADALVSHPDDVTTMWDVFCHGNKIAGDRDFLGVRPILNGVAQPYEWQSHNAVKRRIENYAKGLQKLGLGRQESLGVYGVNRPEWTMTEQACYRKAFIIVALYDTLGEEAIEYIVNQTEMKYIVATSDKVKRLIGLKNILPTIKYIIVMDDYEIASDREAAKAAGIELQTFTEVEKLGEDAAEENDLPSPQDIATICYTSGTTGAPKGAVITQAQSVAVIYSIVAVGDANTFAKVDYTDCYISYLPLAHVFERAAQGLFVYTGGALGYYQGDTAKLLDDIVELKPTVFCSVPRLFNRIYDRVLSGVKSKGGVAAALFFMAYEAKKANLKSTTKHWLWDRLVFGTIRQRLGGRIRFILSGSAPVSPDVMDFMRICFSADVYEGYGQTENFCGSCLTVSKDNTTGVVGIPFPCSEIKLVDVPDMEYTSKDQPFPRGEICIRGNSVMREYYKNPEKTAETLDEDGWLHTGDIGLFDECGRLAIIDRLKNIFKLSQGEYIAPEKIEGVYQKHELIAQAFVYGDSLQSTLVGIIHPDKDELLKWAKAKPEYSDKSFEELCGDAAVNKDVLSAMGAFGKQNGLKGFEQVKKIYLTADEFTVDNDLLTPTFKLKREVAKKKFASEIEAMYAGRSFN